MARNDRGGSDFSAKVWVGRVKSNCPPEFLEAAFKKCGKLIKVETGFAGFAFVDYENEDDADEACKQLNKAFVQNVGEVRVSRATQRGYEDACTKRDVYLRTKGGRPAGEVYQCGDRGSRGLIGRSRSRSRRSRSGSRSRSRRSPSRRRQRHHDSRSRSRGSRGSPSFGRRRRSESPAKLRPIKRSPSKGRSRSKSKGSKSRSRSKSKTSRKASRSRPRSASKSPAPAPAPNGTVVKEIEPELPPQPPSRGADSQATRRSCSRSRTRTPPPPNPQPPGPDPKLQKVMREPLQRPDPSIIKKRIGEDTVARAKERLPAISDSPYHTAPQLGQPRKTEVSEVTDAPETTLANVQVSEDPYGGKNVQSFDETAHESRRSNGGTQLSPAERAAIVRFFDGASARELLLESAAVVAVPDLFAPEILNGFPHSFQSLSQDGVINLLAVFAAFIRGPGDTTRSVPTGDLSVEVRQSLTVNTRGQRVMRKTVLVDGITCASEDQTL